MEWLGAICFFSTIMMLLNRGNDGQEHGGMIAVLCTNFTTIGLVSGLLLISLRISRGRS